MLTTPLVVARPCVASRASRKAVRNSAVPGLAFFKAVGDGLLQQHPCVPGIGGKCCQATCAVGSFKFVGEIQCSFFDGVVVGQSLGYHDRASRQEGAITVFAADAQEVAVGDAVVKVDAAFVAALCQSFRRQGSGYPGKGQSLHCVRFAGYCRSG